MLISWHLVQVLHEAYWGRKHPGVKKSGGMDKSVSAQEVERLRQAVSEAGESEWRAHLHTLCTAPAASVEDRWHAHGATVMLEHACKAMKRAYNVLISWLLMQQLQEGACEGVCTHK